MSHDAEMDAAMARIGVLRYRLEQAEAENARLNAEVDQLVHKVNYWRIEAETDNARWLRCLEDKERLTKAGDAMAKRTEFFQKRWDADELCQEVEAWLAAKEGKQS